MPDDVKPSNLATAKRPRRLGLYAPFALLLLVIVGWSGYWLYARSQLQAGLERQAQALRTQGYAASWSAARIDGFPFRMEVTLTDARLGEPSGWGAAAPRLEGEANAYALDHWVVLAPEGVTLTRPKGGAVAVSGQVLRASLADLDGSPRIALEALKAVFRPAAGAAPFLLTSADRAEFHMRPIEGDKAQVQWRLEGAQTTRAGLLGQIAPLAPVTSTLSLELSKRSAFKGEDWSQAVRRWADAGGAGMLGPTQMSAGDFSVKASGGPLTVGADGRLRGALGLSLREGDAALLALGGAQALDPAAAGAAAAVTRARGDGQTADLQLVFEAGEVTLGPVRLGPALRIY